MTVVEIPPGTHSAARLLGGRFRLDERIGLDDQVPGPCGSSWEARGLSLWKATDQLLGRPVTIYLLPPGLPVPQAIVDAVQSAAKVIDARIATIYDTDFNPECPYIVAEWTPGTHLEDLLRSGLPTPALAAAMIADAADAIAVAHRAGRPHLRLTPRALRWHPGSGLKITGLGLDEALCGPQDPGVTDPMTADTVALARMLYALLTGYWPGDEAAARAAGLPAAPRHKGQVCTPRQVRAGVPAVLDAITYRALQGQAADAPLRAQTLAGLAMALRMVQRPSRLLDTGELDAAELNAAEATETASVTPIRRRPARHARARTGLGLRTTLLRPALQGPLRGPALLRTEFLGAGEGVVQVFGQAVPGGQDLLDPRGHVPGQPVRGGRGLARQVFHLVEEIVQLAGIGVPAVVRVAVGGLGGQVGQHAVQVGPQLDG